MSNIAHKTQVARTPPGFFRSVATLISCIVKTNQSGLEDPFTGAAVPSSLYKYIESLYERIPSPVSSMSKALCYMDTALTANPTFRLTENNVYRFTATAIMLATRGYVEAGMST